MTDPNWLYSTIAQSSAAIVAIIGGFITASILARRAEKTSLSHQLSDKRAQLKGLENNKPGGGLSIFDKGVDSSQEKISSLEAEIRDLETRLATFSYPPDLGGGIGVLGYLAVFGILFPVFMIWTELYSDIAKTLIVYCFYGGILGLFAYIAVQIKMLRR